MGWARNGGFAESSLIRCFPSMKDAQYSEYNKILLMETTKKGPLVLGDPQGLELRTG